MVILILLIFVALMSHKFCLQAEVVWRCRLAAANLPFWKGRNFSRFRELVFS